ncbi:STAS domain-containing protein [Streptomyces sp. RB6PN25]|uniref:STAS domain-containing protein n=1 Tax=Streptomyces humicola TaxID=2953240 RepID=A0ABT1Q1U9_9ACTN|nr:STAS domain-containing protein [Streptomyces humicola]MCQ4082730.1 STAS domain-containing protein [Streptomyces humicola]
MAGQIDLATASQLRGYVNDLLADHGKPTQVIVDLTDVSFCDAYGLGMLNAVHRKAQQKGHTVRFVVSPGRVERLFRIMGGTHGLTPSVHNTLAEAIAPGG